MLIVFELYVRPGFDESVFLSQETREQTQARVLTPAQAAELGLEGLPEPSAEHGEVRYLPVNARHRAWIERAIDAYPEVNAFHVHDVGG